MADVEADVASLNHRLEARLRVLSGALRAFAEATTDYERLLQVVARTVAEAVALTSSNLKTSEITIDP